MGGWGGGGSQLGTSSAVGALLVAAAFVRPPGYPRLPGCFSHLSLLIALRPLPLFPSPAELMLALPDVRPGAGKAAMADSEGWMAVAGKGVRARRAMDVAVVDVVVDGTAAGSGVPAAPSAPLGLGIGGFALLAGLEEGDVGLEADAELGEAEEEDGAVPAEGAEGGEAASSAAASVDGATASSSVVERGSRRKRLLDDSILRCPQRSLIADVMALYRRRLGGVVGARAAQLAVHADAIVVS